MNLLVRLFAIVFGYIFAVVFAASVAALAEFLRAYGPVAHDPAALGLTSMVVLTDWIILVMVIGQAAALPALAVIGAAEAFGWRSVLYFCGAGLVIAFVTALIADPGLVPPFMADPAIAAAAGLAGGASYWLIAGRGSGLATREPARG